MRIEGEKIELSEEESKRFNCHLKKGIILQLQKEEMLTEGQVANLLKSIKI